MNGKPEIFYKYFVFLSTEYNIMCVSVLVEYSRWFFYHKSRCSHLVRLGKNDDEMISGILSTNETHTKKRQKK